MEGLPRMSVDEMLWLGLLSNPGKMLVSPRPRLQLIIFSFFLFLPHSFSEMTDLKANGIELGSDWICICRYCHYQDLIGYSEILRSLWIYR